MTIDRLLAWNQLSGWTKGASLLRHALAVEVVMRRAATEYGDSLSDPDAWGCVGLLHDADYEQWPDEHPARIVRWLRDLGEDEMAHAISAHHTSWGVERTSRLDRALLACDELTGFIVACALVRLDRLDSLKSASVIRKLKDKSFAASVERSEIFAGVAEIGVSLDRHITLIIDALGTEASTLGLAPPDA